MKFHPTYQSLPPIMYSAGKAATFSHPQLIKFNHELSSKLGLGLESTSDEELAQIFSGAKTLEGSDPISLAYAAHQFGHFVPQLGDGRALLMGEFIDPEGKRFDLQLKGSGQTIYSRNGDGKSALGPVLREYILSEAMNNLGVPTTRALAAVLTGDTVYRETPLPGAVFTRVASSHIRIGTFQFVAARDDLTALKALLDYSIQRHYPEIKNQENSAFLFFQQVAKAQTKLIAHWMSLGFIHGVMNTDNMTISGETIDFGPCAFMDHFDFYQVYSFIDRHGRYAYGNQPKILMWNLSRLADCLIPLIDASEKEAIDILNSELSLMPKMFEAELNHRMMPKFGLEYQDGDGAILSSWLEYLQAEKLDFTLSFRKLSDILESSEGTSFPQTEHLKRFEELWRARLPKTEDLKKKMDSINPLFIPRNHQVEKVIQDAIRGEYDSFHELNAVLTNPFSEQAEFTHYSLPPKEEEKIKNTFCGT